MRKGARVKLQFFSAFWLRSNVVSVLISLISGSVRFMRSQSQYYRYFCIWEWVDTLFSFLLQFTVEGRKDENIRPSIGPVLPLTGFLKRLTHFLYELMKAQHTTPQHTSPHHTGHPLTTQSLGTVPVHGCSGCLAGHDRAITRSRKTIRRGTPRAHHGVSRADVA